MEPERTTPKPKGLILKEARLAKKITLQAVHESTKIPLDILKAMEEGYTVRTLSPFYLKGFQKMYAQYLGVDLHEVVEEVKKEETPLKPPSPHPVPPTQETRKRLNDVIPPDKQRLIFKSIVFFLAFFLMIKVVGGVKDRLAANRREERTTRSRRVKKPRQVLPAAQNTPQKAAEKDQLPETVKAETPSVAVQTKKEPVTKEAAQKEEVKKAEPKKEEPKKEEVKKPESKPAPAPAAALKPETPAAPASAAATPTQSPESKPAASKQEKRKDVNLTVSVKKKCWLQVKVDGTVVFQANLNKDEKETWRADKTIEISGNNIENLSFELNGKAVEPPGQKTARRLLITREGISVVK